MYSLPEIHPYDAAVDGAENACATSVSTSMARHRRLVNCTTFEEDGDLAVKRYYTPPPKAVGSTKMKSTVCRDFHILSRVEGDVKRDAIRHDNPDSVIPQRNHINDPDVRRAIIGYYSHPEASPARSLISATTQPPLLPSKNQLPPISSKHSHSSRRFSRAHRHSRPCNCSDDALVQAVRHVSSREFSPGVRRSRLNSVSPHVARETHSGWPLPYAAFNVDSGSPKPPQRGLKPLPTPKTNVPRSHQEGRGRRGSSANDTTHSKRRSANCITPKKSCRSSRRGIQDDAEDSRAQRLRLADELARDIDAMQW